jgi:putative ABC transport system permease protein
MFTDADTSGAPPVVLVSRSWAQHYFPGESAIGQQLIGGGCSECPRTTIIGVVGDVKYQGLAGDGDGVYAPLSQAGSRTAMLFVRTQGAPEGFIKPVLEQLRTLDAELPLSGVTTAEQLRRALADPTRWTAVLSAFAAAALSLSAMGIFGLLSYVVRRQRREIGVRMALGAEPVDVLRMVVGGGMRFVGIGMVVGMGLVAIEGRWLESLLYGVTPHDPNTILAVTGVLLLSALLACLLPGLRAARIRPSEAIAEE